jgi:hypothetical protein
MLRLQGVRVSDLPLISLETSFLPLGGSILTPIFDLVWAAPSSFL